MRLLLKVAAMLLISQFSTAVASEDGQLEYKALRACLFYMALAAIADMPSPETARKALDAACDQEKKQYDLDRAGPENRSLFFKLDDGTGKLRPKFIPEYSKLIVDDAYKAYATAYNQITKHYQPR